MKWLYCTICLLPMITMGQSLHEMCSDGKYFCCESNGKEIDIVYPELLMTEYSLESAMKYCEEKYGTPAGLIKSDYEEFEVTVNITDT